MHWPFRTHGIPTNNKAMFYPWPFGVSNINKWISLFPSNGDFGVKPPHKICQQSIFGIFMATQINTWGQTCWSLKMNNRQGSRSSKHRVSLACTFHSVVFNLKDMPQRRVICSHKICILKSRFLSTKKFLFCLDIATLL